MRGIAWRWRRSHSGAVGYAAVAAFLAFAAGGLSARAETPALGSDAKPAFLDWAATPPKGWNSWDAFGTTLTEKQAKEQADLMAAQLLQYGWKTLTVDIQ